MEFDQFDVNEKTPQDFFKDLVDKAIEGIHSPFEFIRSYQMLKVAKMYKRGVKNVIKIFKGLVGELLTKYVEDEDKNIEILMAMKQFNDCVKYYEKEYAIAKDMISEYRTYVFSGHIFNTIIGIPRPDHECVDYRKLPLF